jgi:non-ribosomal peptide synthetase component F
MLEDTQAPVVLTQQRLLERVPRSSSKLICLDADWELIARERRENSPTRTHAKNLAYIMYTSGSTGSPRAWPCPTAR